MAKFKIEIKWAVIFAVTMLLWMLMERLTGLHGEHIDKHPVFTNLFAIPAIAIYALALLDKRKHFYQGTMTYQQGFITGLIMTLVIAILSPLAQFITSTLITPDFFPNMTEHVVSQGIMTREAAEKQFNLQSYMLQGLIGALVMGVVTSAIVALFTRKKEAPVD